MENNLINQDNPNNIVDVEESFDLSKVNLSLFDLSKCLNISVNLDGWPACITAIGITAIGVGGYCFYKLKASV